MASSVDGELRIGVGIDGSSARKDIAKLGQQVQQILSRGRGKSSAMTSIQNQIRKVTQDLENARKKQKELADTPVYSDTYKKAETQLESYKKQLDNTKQKLDELRAKEKELGEQKVPTSTYLSNQRDIAKEMAQLERLKAKRKQYYDLQRAQNVGDIKIKGTETYKEMSREIALTEKKLKSLQATQQELIQNGQTLISNKNGIYSGEASNEYMKLIAKLKDTQTEYMNTINKAKELNATMKSGEFQRANVSSGTTTDAYTQQGQKVSQLEGKLAQLVQRYNEVGDAAQSSGNKQSLASKFVSKAWSGLKGSLKSIGKNLAGLKKNSENTFSDMASSAKKMFWKILKYGLSIRSLYALFRKLKSTFKDSIKVMGMDIPLIRDQLNSLINGFQQVKYGLATAFQPIMSYVVPVLNTLIGALNSAMVALANFFATLTGQKVIYKATKQNKDYAKSIAGAGSAAEDANEDIAEYDKLIVINQDKAGGGGGGGGDSGLDSGIFEEAPAKINEFAELIKKAWKEADFTDVGAYIGKKLKVGLESIKWGPIRETARKIGKSFATLINGFISVPDLGKRIGTTLSEGINTAWATVNEFVKTLDWANVGRFIGDAISSFLKDLDFSLLGENIGLGLTGIATTIYNTFKTLNKNLPQILDNINRGIDRFLETFNPEMVGKAFGEVSRFILDFVKGILPEIPKITSKLADLFNSLVTNFPSEEFAQTVSGLIRSAIQGVTEFIKKVDFVELGKKIGQFLANLDIMGFATDIAKLIASVITAAFQALPSVIMEAPLESALIALFIGFKWLGLGKTISSTIASSIGSAVTGSGFATVVGGALKTALGALGWVAAGAAAALVGWEIGKSIYNGIAEALGQDPFEALLGDPMERMKQSTKDLDFKSLVYEELQNPYYQLRQEVNELGLTGQEAYKKLAEGLNDIKIDEFLEKHKTGIDAIDSAQKQVIDIWKEVQLEEAKTKYGVDDIKDSYAGIPTEAKKAMETANKEVITGVDELNKQAETVSQTYNGMPSAIQSSVKQSNAAISTSVEEINQKVDTVKDNYNGMPSGVRDKIAESNSLIEESFEGTNQKVEQVKQSYNGMPSDIQAKVEQTNGELTSAFEAVKGKVTELSESVKQLSLKESFEGVKDKVLEIKDAVDEYKKSTAQSGTTTKKATNKSKTAFSALTTQIEGLKEKTDGYNKSMSDTNDTLAKALDTTDTKAKNISTSTHRSFINLKNKITNIAGQVTTAWKGGVEDAVLGANETLESSISSLGQESMRNLATSLTLESNQDILNNAANLGTNINNKISTPFSGTDGAASAIKNSLISVTTDTDISEGYNTLGGKIRNALNNLFDKIGIKKDAQQVKKDVNTEGSIIAKKWGDYGALIRKAFHNAWDKIRKKFVAEDLNKVGRGIATMWGKYGKSTREAFENAWSRITAAFGQGSTQLEQDGATVQGKWEGVANGIQIAMCGAWDKIKGAFETPLTLNINDGLSGVSESLANLPALIGQRVDDALETMRQRINAIILALNMSKFIKTTIQEINWLPKVGDLIDMGPHGANGMVIPPNKEFLAVYGDQRQGTNIETPLQTMIDAFNTALDTRGGNNGSNSAPIVLQLNGKEIARAVWDEDKKKYKQTGKYSPSYS